MARALLFATDQFRIPLMEYRFLPVIQALEVYCGTLDRDEKYISDEEFKPIKKLMYECIPPNIEPDLIKRLKTNIGYANSLSLGDRIKSLFDNLQPETTQFVCLDVDLFTDRLKLTRNYFTHYGDSKGKHLTGRALHWATEQASLLLKLVMLKSCGVPESLIQSSLRASYFRTEARRIWAEIENSLATE